LKKPGKIEIMRSLDRKYLFQMDEFVRVASTLDQTEIQVRNGTASSLSASAKRVGRRGSDDHRRAANDSSE